MADVDVSSLNRAISTINKNISTVNNNVLNTSGVVDQISGTVNNVDSNLKVVYTELGKLAKDFNDYVKKAENQHQLSLATTRKVEINQELEKKYGYYEETRRTIRGVLQATDLEIVRKETITRATEELMLSAPGYWLAPALVGLGAWINDNKELADRAVKEAIRRDDEKTSLLFALICRRADRKAASLKWVQRYLANQDEENLDAKAVIMLDAFAAGLLGADSEGVVAKQIEEWTTHLSNKDGFVEQQTKQWSDAINQKRSPFAAGFPYLRKYSKTWGQLQNIMEGAYLHSTLFDYFEHIFDQKVSTAKLEEQMDEILSTLVTDFDEEERPLQMKKQLNQFVIDYDGDLPRAQASMKAEQAAFDMHKDFMQLLTDAAMKPEISHSSVSTQKFAIALSRDWISAAYNDVVADNRAKIPADIEINIEDFNEKTQNGQNEADLLNKWRQLQDRKKSEALAKNVLSGADAIALPGGVIVGVIGLVMCFAGGGIGIFLGLIAIIAGVAWALHGNAAKKKIAATRLAIEAEFKKKTEEGEKLIRATLAEVVDFRKEFTEKDAESQKVVDFLEQIKPEEYVSKLGTTNRKIKVVV